MKKLLKIFAIIVVLLLAIIFAFIQPVDREHYSQKPHYQATLDKLSAFSNLQLEGDTLQAGWAQVPIIPPFQTAMAGYGNREGAPYEGIKDTLWVRAFVFDNGTTRAALLSADLLIIPPELTLAMENYLPEINWNIQNVYLTATHTHGSIGGWAPGFTGDKFAGEYKPEVIKFLSEQFRLAIQLAENDLVKTKIGFAKIEAPEYVVNRLVGEEGSIDPYVRMIELRREDEKKAVIYSYAAHATCYGGDEMHLHGDYPTPLSAYVQSFGYDMVSYIAGAVGSHGPAAKELPTEDQIGYMVLGLGGKIRGSLASMEPQYQTELGIINSPLHLGKPQARISQNWRIRPWVFKQLFGDYETRISGLLLGDNLLLGFPCDFSGELVLPIEKQWNTYGFNGMISSFNGGYIGYITKDVHYELDSYETRTMNWYGPNNGAYFTELALELSKSFSSSR